MRKLDISIEINGVRKHVGTIEGRNSESAGFRYDPAYLESPEARPISISLPLSPEVFSPRHTKTYFEGLLPEGFTRRSVAQWMHADVDDYMAILAGLGKECLGALRVTEEEFETDENAYEHLSPERVAELAREGATRSSELVLKSHLSLTGASGKVGLYYDEANNEWYLPKGNAPSTHIVKQSHIRLENIITNEQLSLLTARNIGIDVPDSFIISTGGVEDDEVLFATRRFDRIIDENVMVSGGLKVPYRLHQEDLAQALGIPAADKYERPGEHHLKRIFELLRRCSGNPIEDQLKLWDILVFDYLIGNADNHIKNLSLLYSKDLRTIRLAPAYDILSTCIYEESTRNLAFSLAGHYAIDEIDRSVFKEAAAEAGFSGRLAMRHFDNLLNRFEKALFDAADRLSETGYEKALSIRDKILLNGGYRLNT